MNIKKLLNSFKYAISGLTSALKKEQNLKIHFFIMFIVIIFGIIFKLSFLEWMICLILFAIVISGELFNTAIEVLVDVIFPEINPKAKFIKDVSAAGVMVLAFFSAIIGLLIFLPKIISLISLFLDF